MKTLVTCLLLGFALPVCATSSAAAVDFDTSHPGQVMVQIDRQPVATFVWDDPEIPRPYFCGLKTQEGQQVTRNHPPMDGKDVADHPTFHPGLWLAFGDISGCDYWRNKARVECMADTVKTNARTGSGTIQAAFRYLDEKQPAETVCVEKLRCTFVVRPEGYLLLWDSTFTGDKAFSFGDQEEMGLGVRVATSMRAERRERGTIPPGTGTIRDAEGRINGEQVWGNASKWCDYRGTVDGKSVGVTLLCHPENFRPSWFHARDYGLLAANAFGRHTFHKGEPSKVTVEPGQSLRLRYGVFVYREPDSEPVDLEAVYQDYLKLTRTKGK